jgi:hypothetical protein
MKLRVQLNDSERFKFDLLPDDTLKVRSLVFLRTFGSSPSL